MKNGPTKGRSDDVLPLKKSAIEEVAVVGSFANKENVGDKGSSDAKVVDSELVITPVEGIRGALTDTSAVIASKTEVAGNETSLSDANAVVVVTAYYYADLA